MQELFAEGLTGGIGGLVGRSTAFPFDTLRVKLATNQGSSGHGTARPAVGVMTIMRRTLQEEGVGGFYRGLPFSALEGAFQKFLVVFLFAWMKRSYKRFSGRDAALVVTLVLGYFSDLLSVPFSMPLEAMVVQLQSAPVGASKSEIIRKAIFTFEGVKKAMKSGRAYIVLSLKPGIEFAVFDRIKSSVLRGQTSDLPALSAFSLGAVARAIATCCVYPYSRGKALCQAQIAPSALAALREVVRTEGPTSMYKGLTMELCRGVTQAAVMFMVMEKIRAAVRNVLVKKALV